jgi:hypothetical protein
MDTIRLACIGSLSALGAAVVTGGEAATPARSALPALDAFPYVLGTQTFGAAYQFTDASRLVETAEAILAMGSNTLKFRLSKDYATGPAANVRQPLPEVRCLRDPVEKEPAHRRVLELPFAHYLIWVYPFAPGWWKDGYPQDVSEAQSVEVYDLACHLLRTYSGTGKSFYLGHWEGDWHLRDGYDTGTDEGITPVRIQGMADWLNARQKAIDDARRDTPHTGVHVWNYAEVNLVRLAMQGRRTVTNDVLPKANVDFVSYSSYDTQADPKTLTAALDYIESKLPPKPGIAGRRVFIGEYGFPAVSYSPAEQERLSRQVMRTALAWGCPFALYWEMYNNEVDKDGRQRGFWLIDDKGVRQPVYETHRSYYEWARKYVGDAVSSAGGLPAADAFRQAAGRWLEATTVPAQR